MAQASRLLPACGAIRLARTELTATTTAVPASTMVPNALSKALRRGRPSKRLRGQVSVDADFVAKRSVAWDELILVAPLPQGPCCRVGSVAAVPTVASCKWSVWCGSRIARAARDERAIPGLRRSIRPRSRVRCRDCLLESVVITCFSHRGLWRASVRGDRNDRPSHGPRSEEHTSEL